MAKDIKTNPRPCKLCGEELVSQKQIDQFQELIARTKVNKFWAHPTEKQLRQLAFLETLLKEKINGKGAHDKKECEKTELHNGRQEIKRLRQSVSDWKDAWFQLREIIGDLWWHHPNIKERQADKVWSVANSTYSNDGNIRQGDKVIGRWK